MVISYTQHGTSDNCGKRQSPRLTGSMLWTSSSGNVMWWTSFLAAMCRHFFNPIITGCLARRPISTHTFTHTHTVKCWNGYQTWGLQGFSVSGQMENHVDLRQVRMACDEEIPWGRDERVRGILLKLNRYIFT